MATAPAPVDLNYLFRFRDLIAPTIEQHRAIIHGERRCWWGWWKRPTEGARDDIWRSLAERARPESPVPVGFFDSGSNRVYVSYVIRVIPPTGDPAERVAVPASEERLIPDYYRHSPFSRAWMELISIGEPIDFFKGYSFAEPPAVPEYKLDVLSRFRDKVIMTGQELRGMDTTIWLIRPRKEEDRTEEIILSTRLHAKPVFRESRDLQASTILHITDPHFALGTRREKHVWALESEQPRARPTMIEAIQQALPRTPIGLVMITGDFSFTGAPEEFREAAAAINRLLGFLNLDTDRLVIIPGNHDICWTKTETYDESAPVTEAPEAAKANYKAFYRQLFGHDANQTLSMARRFTLPSGLVVEVCGLNSSSLETGPQFLAGMGRIEEASFEEAANELEWGSPSLSLRILALHHHVVLTENREPERDYYRGYGLAVDAPRILRMAAKKGRQHRAPRP